MVEELKKRVEIDESVVIRRNNVKEHREMLKGVEVLFGTWGVEHFTVEEIRAYFPALKVF